MMTKLCLNAFALLVALTFVAPVNAQQRPAACGAISEEIASIEDFAPYFFDLDMSNVRGNEITLLAATQPKYIVSDSTECTAVHAAAIAHLQAEGSDWVDFSSGGHDFTIFRFGPYYAIVLLNNTTSQKRLHYSPLVVLRAADLAYVVSIAT